MIKKINEKKIIDQIIKVEKSFIKQYSENYLPKAFIVNESGKIELIGMRFGSDEKEIMRDLIKKTVLTQKTLFYLLCFDCKVTSAIENEFNNVTDALVINYYSKNKVVRNVFIYDKDKKFGEVMEQEYSREKKEEGLVNKDNWDVWGESIEDGEDETELIESYFDFKNKNKKLYK